MSEPLYVLNIQNLVLNNRVAVPWISYRSDSHCSHWSPQKKVNRLNTKVWFWKFSHSSIYPSDFLGKPFNPIKS